MCQGPSGKGVGEPEQTAHPVGQPSKGNPPVWEGLLSKKIHPLEKATQGKRKSKTTPFSDELAPHPTGGAVFLWDPQPRNRKCRLKAEVARRTCEARGGPLLAFWELAPPVLWCVLPRDVRTLTFSESNHQTLNFLQGRFGSCGFKGTPAGKLKPFHGVDSKKTHTRAHTHTPIWRGR